MTFQGDSFGEAWFGLLNRLYRYGTITSPRGRKIREFTGVTLKVDNGLQNILISPTRNLNHKFMVAEWLWIWFGHEDVATIARYNKNIAQFSDDGVKFTGAYGPPVISQWPYVVGRLRRDLDSRQAVINIFNPPQQKLIDTKDVPCTLSVQFMVRNAKVETIVCMRSSDIWLGLPYDFFNFSMMANILAAQLGCHVGSVIYHLGSSHLYEDNAAQALEVLNNEDIETLKSPKFYSEPLPNVDMILQGLETTVPRNWPFIWQQYSEILVSPRSKTLEHLNNLSEV